MPSIQKQVSVPVYQFDELDESGKQKAIETVKDQNNAYLDGDDCLVENWKEKLETIGFLNAEIFYSHMYCQGQGASFTADVDLSTVIDHMIMISPDLATARIYQAAQNLEEKGLIGCRIIDLKDCYDHEFTKTIDYEIFFNDKKDLAERTFKDIEALRVRLCQQIMATVISEDEYQNSDECVIQNIESSEHYFFANGDIATQHIQ